MERNVFRLPRLPRWVKYAAALGAVIGTCVGAAASLRYRRWNQPSGSMWPTIVVGDHFYSRRVNGAPERGQIAVFKYPEHPEQSFTKRVVGLPGDVIETKGHDVLVNGWPVPCCAVGKASYKDVEENIHAGELAMEWLGAETYLVFHEMRPAAGHTGPFTVRAGEYFVLGDNRDDSNDSRTWNGGAGGGVPFASTQGVVSMRLEKLPSHLDASLAPAFAACLAKRPAQTAP